MPVIITNIPNETQNSLVDNRVSLLDPHTLLVKTSQQQGILLFIEYTKGDESSVVISQSIRRDNDPSENNFYDVIYKNADGNLVPFESKLESSSKIVYPIAIDYPSDWCKIKFEFKDAVNEGTVRVLCKINNPYV